MSDAIWVAIIAASSAIIPQLINLYVSYKKDVELKKLELYNQNRLNVITEFLDSVGSIYSKDGMTLKQKYEFQKSSQKLLLYFPDIDSKEFDKIFKSMSEWDITKRFEALQPLIKRLAKSIKDK